MKRTTSNRSKPVSEQAAEWYVELDEPPHSDELRRDFFAWLKQSPRHIEEFLAVAELERVLGRQSSSIDELVREVGSATGRQAVAFVGGAGQEPEAGDKRSGRRWQVAALAAAAGVAALAALFAWRPPAAEAPAASHRTELGEQRSIALGDGSIMTLNTLTETVVRFDGTTRLVSLVSGEAMFEVARDPQRPFVVESGDLSVSVVGTKFSMYRKGRSTHIAVVEGVVDATANGDAMSHIELHGGEGAVFDDGELRRDATFDLERAVAWTGRVLVFENTRLADVVDEFNRYNRMQLRIDDPQLADRPVTLTRVNAHDVSSLIAFLRLEPDVRVDYGADTIRIGKATDTR